jgi:AraC family transcriptional regulator of adaptative response/methylated-DNA-[protein]-cysteine methyltransferase
MYEGATISARNAGEESRILDRVGDEIRRQAVSGCEFLCMTSVLRIAPWSRRQMERRFRERYLTSPARYFRDVQAENAEALLRSGKDVLSAAMGAGFASPGRLHDAVVARRGMTPGELRQGGAGVRIAFGFFDTPLGIVLMGRTERGLCALRLCAFTGAECELADMRAEFPQAKFVEDPTAMQADADQLVAFLDARAETFAPCLDILRGTTLQREVWAELQRLKPGEVISYSTLAERVGHPEEIRAVTDACAINNLAIAIPCHRACHKDGRMEGVRWGTVWKQRLLELEARMAGQEDHTPDGER